MQNEIALAYSDMLKREPWQWFATLTFRPDHERPSGGVHIEKADKAFRYFLRCLNESLYGKRWMRTQHGGIIWARGQEFHKNGRPHFHAVLAAPDRDLNTSASRYSWHEFWYREWGRNQIEQPRNQDEICGYVSKYVAKDGEVDFSHNFGTVKPPALPWLDCNEGSSAVNPSLHAQRIGLREGKDRTRQPACLSLTLPVRLPFAYYATQPETST
jgi:hypothetical protein